MAVSHASLGDRSVRLATERLGRPRVECGVYLSANSKVWAGERSATPVTAWASSAIAPTAHRSMYSMPTDALSEDDRLKGEPDIEIAAGNRRKARKFGISHSGSRSARSRHRTDRRNPRTHSHPAHPAKRGAAADARKETGATLRRKTDAVVKIYTEEIIVDFGGGRIVNAGKCNVLRIDRVVSFAVPVAYADAEVLPPTLPGPAPGRDQRNAPAKPLIDFLSSA